MRSIHRLLLCLPILSLITAGCYTPGGGMLASSSGLFSAQTYYSTSEEPKTLSIIDLRNGDNVFEMKIPVGKQLVIQFYEDSGDDPVYTPDLMKYQVSEIGTKFGSLGNSVTVPDAYSRRVDLFIRPGDKYEAPEANRPLRTDELLDRPPHWTPTGGEADHRHDPMGTYDD